jgi:hypothetical protein
MQRAVIAQIAAGRIASMISTNASPPSFSASAQVCTLSIHISTVSTTKRWSSPHRLAACYQGPPCADARRRRHVADTGMPPPSWLRAAVAEGAAGRGGGRVVAQRAAWRKDWNRHPLREVRLPLRVAGAAAIAQHPPGDAMMRAPPLQQCARKAVHRGAHCCGLVF